MTGLGQTETTVAVTCYINVESVYVPVS